ncbi:hypothetical protein GP486_001242 [Trichoglossum hirsutum]|uniref:Ankyrin repeat protein n=1 Tax=Trichoglossum hirsutum TaxID=265104 RepID=A0A9P8LHI1_9PEZI|nr:hypothetical protein GP486_001242 [Trichoglossum hirsutum]
MSDSFSERWMGLRRRGVAKITKGLLSPVPKTSSQPDSLVPNPQEPADEKAPASPVHPVNLTPSDLWDRAEESLHNDKDKGKIMQAYLEILGLKLTDGSIVKLGNIGTSDRQKQLFLLTEKKVEELKEERWKLHWGGHEVGVVTLVNGIANGVRLAKDVASSTTCAGPHTALACAGVSVILSMLVNPVEQLRALLEGLDYISALICRFIVVERVYRTRAGISSLRPEEATRLEIEFEAAVARLYSQVLEFQARALCHLSRHPVTRFFNDMFKADGWDTLLVEMRKSELTCRGFTQLIDSEKLQTGIEEQKSRMEGLQQTTTDILTVLKTDKGERQIEEENAFFQALYTSDYEEHKARNRNQVPGTCEWFTSHQLFRSWQESRASSLLWVSADPGCGKSVLAKYLIDDVLQSTKSRTTCYFFFKDDNTEQRSAVNALCALLRQLFLLKKTLLQHAIPQFQRDGSRLANSFHNLWDILVSTALDPEAGEIVCILDALDECEEKERIQLLQALGKYYRILTNDGNCKTALKFLVTSRPYVHIQREFQMLKNHLPTIHLSGENETKKISGEIDLVIKSRVQEIGDKSLLEPKERSFLQNELSAVPNRTYLWLTLILEVIERSLSYTDGNVRRIISTMPKTVEEAYEKILNRSADVTRAKRLLHIVVAATRPLTLMEMNLALAINESYRTYQELELEPEDRFRTTVRSLCGLFVTIIDGRIYLLHQTAKEFLVSKETGLSVCHDDISRPRLHRTPEKPLNPKETVQPISQDGCPTQWMHSLKTQESNSVLAKICIWYLLFTVSENHPPPIHESTYEHVFLDYSAKNWADHFREAHLCRDMAIIKQVLEICDSRSRRFLTWFRIYCTTIYRLHPRGFTDLMIGSYFGHDVIVELLLEKGADLEPRDKAFGLTPLLWAAKNGHDAVVKLLLENGARLESKDIISGRTPLSWAAVKGRDAVVKLLLENGSDLESKNNSGRTPLWWAAENGHITVAKLLLEKGANPESKDRVYGRTVLSWAAANGLGAMVKLLLENGADPESRDSTYGQTPLLWAAMNGHDAVVKLLLEETNLESKNNSGQTPLLWAAENGHIAVARLLLENGANLESKDRISDQTPLSYAAMNGHDAVVKLLLENGADLESRDSSYNRTPLLWAMRNGNDAVVKLLLEKGVNLESKDSLCGRDPL